MVLFNRPDIDLSSGVPDDFLKPPSTFNETLMANVEFLGSVFGKAKREDELYDARSDAIFKRLGVRLDNPLRAVPEAIEPQLIADARNRRISEFHQRLRELQTQHPDAADIIRADLPVGIEAAQATQAAEEHAAEMARRYPYRLPDNVPLVGGMSIPSALGGLATGFTDPYTLATLPFFGARTGVGAAGIAWGAMKAAAANAVGVAAEQPGIAAWKSQAGIDYGAGDALKSVAAAAAFGFVVDAGVRSVSRGVRRTLGHEPVIDAAGDVIGYKRADPRAAPLDALDDAARAAPPEAFIRRAAELEPDALREVAARTGLDQDPDVRAALDIMRLDEMDGRLPAGVAEPEHVSRANDALRAANDQAALPPGDAIVAGHGPPAPAERIAEVLQRDPIRLAAEIRDAPQMLDEGLPWTLPKMRMAAHLARLDEPAFDIVAAGEAHPALGALVAEHVVDPAQHAGLLRRLAHETPSSLPDARAKLARLMEKPRGPGDHAVLAGGDARLVDRPVSLVDDPHGPDAMRQLDQLRQRHAAAIEAATGKATETVGVSDSSQSVAATSLREAGRSADATRRPPTAADKVADAIDRALARAQLPDGITLKRFSDVGDLPEGLRRGIAGRDPEGFYHDGAIWIAADALDPDRVISHETVHALRKAGLLSDAEMSLLAAKADELDEFRGERRAEYEQAYAHMPDAARAEAILQEKVAHLYERRANGANYGGEVNEILRRIRQFLERVRNALKGHGWQNADDIMKAIDDGTIARRAVRDVDMVGGNKANGLPLFSLRDTDDLGFYSHLDRVLRSLGHSDTVTAQTLQKRGVKTAEMEARGISTILADGKSAKVKDLIETAGKSEHLRESAYGGSNIAGYRKSAIERRMAEWEEDHARDKDFVAADDSSIDGHGDEQVQDSIREFLSKQGLDVDAALETAGGTYDDALKTLGVKWRIGTVALFDDADGYFYIIEAPNGAVSVLSDTGEFSAKSMLAAIAELEFSAASVFDDLRSSVLEKIEDAVDRSIRHGTADISDATRWRSYALDPGNGTYDEVVLHLPRRDKNFQSSHWAQPNVVAHARTSMQKDASGNNVFVVNELQSDWGQALRDGRTAETTAPVHPLVNTTDQWVDTAMRRMLARAVESGADSIAIPSGRTVEAYGMGAPPDGVAYAYDKMYPKNLRNIIQKLDKSVEGQRVDELFGLSGEDLRRSHGFTVFPITDKIRAAVEEGQPLFALRRDPAEREAKARAVMESPEWKRAASREAIAPGDDTALVPGFGGPEWQRTRAYVDESGTSITGFDNVVSHFTAGAEAAVPGGVKSERQAFILIGYPGAGKSTIAKAYRDQYQAARLVGDDAKPLMPEYRGGANNGGVKIESDLIAAAAAARLMKTGGNLVMETAGHEAGVRQRVKDLKGGGYDVTLVFVDVPKPIAMERAVARFEREGRPVPLTLYDTLPAAEVYGKLQAEGAVDNAARIVPTEDEAAWRVADIAGARDDHDAVRANIEHIAPWRPEGRGSGGEDAVGGAEGTASQNVDPGEDGPLFTLRAYHGTPHKVDRFSSDKIGTGEGAQVYGHGLYFAESEGVARWYRDRLSGSDWTAYGEPAPFYRGRLLRGRIETNAAAVHSAYGGDIDAAIAGVTSHLARALADLNREPTLIERMRLKRAPEKDRDLLVRMVDLHKATLQQLQQWKSEGDNIEWRDGGGNLYRVKINAEPEQLLDWDKPIGEQSATVKQALQKLGIHELGDDGIAINDTGAALHARLEQKLGSAPEVSRALREAGVAGIRYLDGASRGQGAGTHNFVLFDEGLIQITDVNGQPVAASGGAGSADPGSVLYSLRDDAQAQLKADFDEVAAIADAKAKAQRERQALIDEGIRAKNERFVTTLRDARGQIDPAKALVHLIESHGEVDLPAGMTSVVAEQKAVEAMAKAGMEELLHEFRPTVVSGKTRQTARLLNVVRELAGEGTGDAAAAGLAQAWARTHERLRQEFNAAGGDIPKLEGWFLPQMHDRAALLAAGRTKWVNDIFAQLDLARIVDGETRQPLSPTEIKAALSDIWENIASDGHGTQGANATDPFGGVTGDATGAKKLANQRQEHRFLHFKSADAWLDYQKQYGGGADPFAAMMQHVTSMAKDIAAMRVLGTNPSRELARLSKFALKQAAMARPARVLIDEAVTRVKDLSARYMQAPTRLDEVSDRIGMIHKQIAAIREKRFGPPSRRNKKRLEVLREELFGLDAERIAIVEAGPARVEGLEGAEIRMRLEAAYDDLNAVQDVDKVLFPKRTEILGKTMTQGGFWTTAPEDYARSHVARAEAMWDLYRGVTSAPVNAKAAAVMQSLRNIGVIGRGGSMVISSIADNFTQVMARRFVGTPAARTFTDILHELGPNAKREAQRQAMIGETYLHMFNDGARAVAGMQGPEWTHYLAERTIALQGLNALTDAQRRGFGMSLQAAIADLAPKTWTEIGTLNPRLQKLFQRYGLSAHDWDAIRLDPATGNVRAVDFLSPNLVRDSLEAAGRGEERVAERYLGMILQETDFASPTSMLRARAAMVGKNRPGTLVGELLRTAGQFKQFAFMFGMLHFERALREAVAHGSARGASYAAQVVTVMTLGGALVVQLKDLKGGKDTRPMDRPGFWYAALAQGGGLGIWGDLLNAEQNRFGGGLVSTLAGPVVGEAEDVMGALGLSGRTTARRGTARLLSSYVPGSSLWYTNLAWQRIAAESLQRQLDPQAYDAFRRRQTQQLKDYGNGFWWAPGDTAPARGPRVN